LQCSKDMSHPSLWTSSSAPLPFRDIPLTGAESCDVAVIGAGITGLTAAYLLQQRGLSVVLLDKAGVAEGDTAQTTAHMTVELDVRYHELISRLGKETTERIAASQAAAIRQIESLVEELGVECGFRRLPGYLYAEEASQVGELEREYSALSALGISASLIRSVPMPFPVRAAVRIENQAELRPLDYCRALLAAFLEKGGRLYTRSPVTELDDGDPCKVYTEGGELSARSVLVCSHSPLSSRVFIHTKVASYRTYAIGAEWDGHEDLNGLFWDVADPYHYLRWANVNGRGVLILGGEDRKTGDEENTEARFSRLENYLKKRIPEARVHWRWSGQVIDSLDGLPFIGQNPMDKHIYIATGFAGNGTTQGTLAALLLRDAVLDRHNPWADLYRANRLLGVSQVPHYVQENKDFPVCFISDRFKSAPAPETLAPGEGGIVFANGNRVAAYRDEGGKFHALDPVCTHLGCLVRFNQAEKTWDCPCHGSRFNLEGTVMNGPAKAPLSPVSTDSWPLEESEETKRTGTTGAR
jgi:glycine/D-amino acid oxidase-like deaminating enzyme/nitrite reductase/ring-hydroxylating ferredoxin subunit